MKDDQKFHERLIAVFAVYDKVLSTAVLDIYWETLKEFEDEIIFEALSEGIKKYWEFCPRPAHIYKLAKEILSRHQAIERSRQEKIEEAEKQRFIESECGGPMPLAARQELDKLKAKWGMGDVIEIKQRKVLNG